MEKNQEKIVKTAKWNTVFLYLMPCGSSKNQSFGTTYPRNQGGKIQRVRNNVNSN
jgi:hypothetical protein